MTETPWNIVTLGDGRRASLVPKSSWLRLRDPDDGHVICNHGYDAGCTLSDHETIQLYEVVILSDEEVDAWTRQAAEFPKSVARRPGGAGYCLVTGKTIPDPVLVAELLEEVRRSHAEIDRWERCAGEWKARCDELEVKLGEALQGDV